MSPCLSAFLFFLVILPSGDGLFGNDGAEIRTCFGAIGRCYFGCKPGWQWVAYCHNMMACCIKMEEFIPPQASPY